MFNIFFSTLLVGLHELNHLHFEIITLRIYVNYVISVLVSNYFFEVNLTTTRHSVYHPPSLWQ